MREFAARASGDDRRRVEALGFGEMKASPRKMVAQALLHGVHHRGQLAAFLRQQGYEGLWQHDLILTNVLA